jgi:hypothetical protein
MQQNSNDLKTNDLNSINKLLAKISEYDREICTIELQQKMLKTMKVEYDSYRPGAGPTGMGLMYICPGCGASSSNYCTCNGPLRVKNKDFDSDHDNSINVALDKLQKRLESYIALKSGAEVTILNILENREAYYMLDELLQCINN